MSTSARFFFGFILVVVTATVFNALSVARMGVAPGCADCLLSAGVPFPFIAHGGFFTETFVIWRGVLDNVAAPLSLPCSLGWHLSGCSGGDRKARVTRRCLKIRCFRRRPLSHNPVPVPNPKSQTPRSKAQNPRVVVSGLSPTASKATSTGDGCPPWRALSSARAETVRVRVPELRNGSGVNQR